MTELSEHWRKKAGLATCEFDVLLGKVAGRLRGAATDFRSESVRKKKFGDLVDKIAEWVLVGAPLSPPEFRIAQAMRFIVTNLDYDEFYRTRWYENENFVGYGDE